MSDQEIRIRLNQQQLELLDRTVGEMSKTTRQDLLIQALREYQAERFDGVDRET